MECKVEGCTNEAQASTGIYGRLCARHAEEKRSSRAPAAADGLAGQVRALIPLAVEVDRAKKRLDANGAVQKLEAELAEAIRRATGAPTDENLTRLEQATKALKRARPKHGTLEQHHRSAHQKFRVALTEIVRGLTA
jgi:hypothetical protein